MCYVHVHAYVYVYMYIPSAYKEVAVYFTYKICMCHGINLVELLEQIIILASFEKHILCQLKIQLCE